MQKNVLVSRTTVQLKMKKDTMVLGARIMMVFKSGIMQAKENAKCQHKIPCATADAPWHTNNTDVRRDVTILTQIEEIKHAAKDHHINIKMHNYFNSCVPQGAMKF